MDNRDWGSYESDPERNRKINNDLDFQRRTGKFVPSMEEDNERYERFLQSVEDIGRGEGVKFKYTEQKICALREVGLEGLRGFGSFENILKNLGNGTEGNRIRFAVNKVYEEEIKKAEEYMRDCRGRES